MRKLTIFYDDWCEKCAKFSHFVVKNDVFRLVEVKPLRKSVDFQKVIGVDFQKTTTQMASYDGERIYYGFNSIYMIFKRLPIFWIFFPLLFLLKITKMGHLLYNEFALRRKIIPLHCDENNCSIKY